MSCLCATVQKPPLHPLLVWVCALLTHRACRRLWIRGESDTPLRRHISIDMAMRFVCENAYEVELTLYEVELTFLLQLGLGAHALQTQGHEANAETTPFGMVLLRPTMQWRRSQRPRRETLRALRSIGDQSLNSPGRGAKSSRKGQSLRGLRTRDALHT